MTKEWNILNFWKFLTNKLGERGRDRERMVDENGQRKYKSLNGRQRVRKVEEEWLEEKGR